MSDIFDIKDMTEEDIKLQFITPALTAKWDVKKITMETSPANKFTDGKVHIKGNIPSRDKGKRCDYVLWYNKGTPLAIVEAKDNNHSSSFGMQQAITYGIMMNVPFVYTSNGDSFFEHDFTTGLEKEFPLSEFPTAEELYNRWKNVDAEKIVEVENRMLYSIDGNTKVYDVPLCFEENLMNTPFYSGADCYPPRYYQRNAVNRTLEAIAKHQARILIAMATGTGKTYTAFQIVWRLIESGTKKKVLYLADRNNLVDQSIQQDFKPLEKLIHKINFQKEDKSKISAYQVYFALYQQLYSAKHHDEDEEETEEEIELEVSKYKEFFTPDFFDLIIVDECHRGSAKADSRWRKILEYFNGATQIGMTATPKETKYVSNIDYFGEPVYSYSLKQGIEDGFLAPFKVSDGGGDGPGGEGPTNPKVVQVVGKGGVNIKVLQRLVSIYDTDGKLLKQESIEDYTKESILGTYQTLENFIQTWNGEQKKEIIRNMLKEKGIDLELIKKDQNMTDVDDFDFICHIAFNQKPLTRRERAENVKKRDIFGKYGEAAREVINALLDKYAELGIYDIESTEILKQNPFTKYGKPARIAALFGGNDKYRAALRELENELYKVA